MMHGDGRIDQIAAQRPQPRQRPLLIGGGKPAVSGYVRRQPRLPGSSTATVGREIQLE
jgi:hypothetical protein